MSATPAPRLAIGPGDAPAWIVDAVLAGGGEVVAVERADGLIWSSGNDPEALADVLARCPDLRWVQLPYAGIEPYVHLLDADRYWTCGKGVYADPVAESALTLALAGMRDLGVYARARSWGSQSGRNLLDARVSILGGGGIAESLVRLLAPFRCHITVVRARAVSMDGVDEVLEADRYIDALPGADLVVLALPLTPDTEGIMSRSEFETMERHAWLVNVARGKHVVTDDLVWALQNGVIAGAGLDVTEPEPLPEGHPLWTLPNCIITPHVGITDDMTIPLLASRITANVRRFVAENELLGLVDPTLGY